MTQGRLSKKAAGDRLTNAEEWELRDKYLERYIWHTCHSNRRDFDDYEEDPMLVVDEDDSDYEEQKEYRQLDLEKAIKEWVCILQKFPDKAQASALWDRLKENDSEDFLFGVDEVAEKLAS